MNAGAGRVQRAYLVLLLLHTVAASFISGINTLFLPDVRAHMTVRVGVSVIASVITRRNAEGMPLKQGDCVRAAAFFMRARRSCRVTATSRPPSRVVRARDH